jgi:hypothetical protein
MVHYFFLRTDSQAFKSYQGQHALAKYFKSMKLTGENIQVYGIEGFSEPIQKIVEQLNWNYVNNRHAQDFETFTKTVEENLNYDRVLVLMASPPEISRFRSKWNLVSEIPINFDIFSLK